MTRRVYLTTDGAGGYMLRGEPPLPPNAKVTVRPAQDVCVFDGVWVDGQRSYDTYVLIDGVVRYHAPPQGLADVNFDWHEQAGGGHAP